MNETHCRRSVSRGDDACTDPSSHPVRLAFEAFLDYQRATGYSRKTTLDYERITGRFIDFLCGQCNDLDEVKPHHITSYLASLQERGLSPWTVNAHYRRMHAFWNWCLKQELVEHDPFLKLRAPRLTELHKPALSTDEVKRLLDGCTGKDWQRLRDRAILLVCLDTGLRLSELLAMRVADGKRDRFIVTGKGRKQRVVFLSAQTRYAISKYLSNCPYRLNDYDPLWWGERGRMTFEGMRMVFRHLSERTGVKVTSHTLRRTFATDLIRDETPLEAVRQLLGHSSLQAMAHYLRLTETDLQQMHERHSPVKRILARKETKR